MPLPIPRQIEDDGLEKWLNDRKEDHNNFGYDHFVTLVTKFTRPDGTVKNKSAIADAFNVERRTIARWINRYRTEQTDDNN
jgi:DNA invertase Pin-like site-specific DNA recombinase